MRPYFAITRVEYKVRPRLNLITFAPGGAEVDADVVAGEHLHELREAVGGKQEFGGHVDVERGYQCAAQCAIVLSTSTRFAANRSREC